MKNFFILFSLLWFGLANAQTNVSGNIYVNTTWTAVNSPYIVTDTVVVFPGVTLTVEPGVIVKFDTLTLLEIREARLIALGTAIDSITFTSNVVAPTAHSWAGIFLNGGILNSQFSYCNLSYARDAITCGSFFDTDSGYTLTIDHSKLYSNYNGIWGPYIHVNIDYCEVSNNIYMGIYAVCQVSNCHFSNNGYGIYALSDNTGSSYVTNCIVDSNQIGLTSKSEVYDCLIQYNHTGVRLGGIVANCIIKYNQIGGYMDDGPVEIKNCILDSNSRAGIIAWGNQSIACNIIECEIKYNGIGIVDSLCSGSIIRGNQVEYNGLGIRLISDEDSIYCNKICNNTAFDLEYKLNTNSSCIINNYWCSDFSAHVASHIYDGHDTTNLGLLTFLPFDTVDCYLTSGVENNNNSLPSINVYPNPASFDFTIEINLIINTTIQAEIINTLGQTVYTFNEKANTGLYKKTIDLNLGQGIYFLTLQTNQGLMTKRIEIIN